MIDRLPGLNRFDVRRLEHTVDTNTVVGAVAGFVLATIVLSPAPLLQGSVHRAAGFPWGRVAVLVYKLAVVYAVVVVAANKSKEEP